MSISRAATLLPSTRYRGALVIIDAVGVLSCLFFVFEAFKVVYEIFWEHPIVVIRTHWVFDFIGFSDDRVIGTMVVLYGCNGTYETIHDQTVPMQSKKIYLAGLYASLFFII